MAISESANEEILALRRQSADLLAAVKDLREACLMHVQALEAGHRREHELREDISILRRQRDLARTAYERVAREIWEDRMWDRQDPEEFPGITWGAETGESNARD